MGEGRGCPDTHSRRPSHDAVSTRRAARAIYRPPLESGGSTRKPRSRAPRFILRLTGGAGIQCCTVSSPLWRTPVPWWLSVTNTADTADNRNGHWLPTRMAPGCRVRARLLILGDGRFWSGGQGFRPQRLVLHTIGRRRKDHLYGHIKSTVAVGCLIGSPIACRPSSCLRCL